jgi:hypothetical protein
MRRRRRQWGRGSLKRTANGTWQIRWRENGRRRARGGLESLEDAERVLSMVLGDLAQGRSGLPPDPRRAPKLGALAGPFLDRPAEVDAGRIRAFIELKRAEALNPATVRILIAILSALLTDLVERGIA